MPNLFSEIGTEVVNFAKGNRAATSLTLASAGFATMGGVAEFNANRKDRNSPGSGRGLHSFSKASYGISAISGLAGVSILGHRLHKMGVQDTMFPGALAKGKAVHSAQLKSIAVEHTDEELLQKLQQAQRSGKGTAEQILGPHSRGNNSAKAGLVNPSPLLSQGTGPVIDVPRSSNTGSVFPTPDFLL